MLLILLTGCGSAKPDDIVGTWKAEWTDDDGVAIERVLSFEADGTYTYDAYMDGESAAYDNGTYEIEGKKLILYSSVDNEEKECTYNGSELTFFDTQYTKAD